MKKKSIEELSRKPNDLGSTKVETFGNDERTLTKELERKQRELETKNRELFIVKQELEYFHSKYEKIYQNSLNGYFTFDNNGTILKLNTTGAKQLGSNKEFLVQKSFINFIVPEHRNKFKMHLENLFSSMNRETCELKIQRNDKSLFYAQLESVPTNGYGGYTLTCETAIRDITMFRVAGEALKESEMRFQNMANTAPVLIWITDAEALFTFVNNFWLDYTGRTLGQELGMNWAEGIHPDDLNHFMDIYKTSFDERKSFEVEFRIKKHDGNYRWIISKGVPRFTSDGRFAGYIGSCTDINDQKVIQEAVKTFNDDLKKLNSSKDKFFSIIAHDLKSPLSGLIGFTEILVEEYDELHEDEKKEFISHSNQAANNLMALLENLLEWSRIQTGNIVFTPVRFDVRSAAEEVFNLFAQNAKNKSIMLEMKVSSYISVLADTNMFDTILRNLISNGIKFTKEGGFVSLSAAEKNNSVEIIVEDSGVGISQENINKLFAIDANYSTPGTNKERGTGLGLMLCKELVEKNNGTIKVESELGKGTKFILILPM